MTDPLLSSRLKCEPDVKPSPDPEFAFIDVSPGHQDINWLFRKHAIPQQFPAIVQCTRVANRRISYFYYRTVIISVQQRRLCSFRFHFCRNAAIFRCIFRQRDWFCGSVLDVLARVFTHLPFAITIANRSWRT